MPRFSTPDRSEWSYERLDALARAMYPAIFGRPAPAAENVVELATRRPAPCPAYVFDHEAIIS
jgi:hypothetical protein